MAQWLSYPTFSGPFSGQEQLLAASSTSPGAGMIRIPWSAVSSMAGGSPGTGFLPLTGGTLSGPLTLPGNATLPLQAVPLQQVQAITGGPFLQLAGGTLTGPLTLAADPTVALGAATKEYVDGAVAGGSFLPLTGGTVTGPIVLPGNATLALQAVPLQQVTAIIGGPYLPLGGGTLTGALVLAADPTLSLGAATKQYVDAAVVSGPFLPLAGGTVTGATTFSADVTFSGASTGLAVSNNATVGGTFVATGGINGTPVGAVTPSTGAFTNLAASGTVTLPSTTTGPFLLLTGGTVSGPTTFSSSGTALTVTNNATAGTLTVGSGSQNNLTVTPGASTSANVTYVSTAGAPVGHQFGASSGNAIVIKPQATSSSTSNIAAIGTGSIGIVSGGTSPVLIGASGTGAIQAQQFTTANYTNTLSGSTIPAVPGIFTNNPTGTSTAAGNQLINFGLKVGSGSDNAKLSSTGAHFIEITSVTTGAAYDGTRIGIVGNQLVSTATTFTNPAAGLIGAYLTVGGSANVGGTSGYGNRAGVLFGADFTVVLNAAATNWLDSVGVEIDVLARTGSSVGQQAGLQIVHLTGHAVQGSDLDVALIIGDQGGVTAGWLNGIQIGNGFGLWPIDVNSGYLFQAVGSQNFTAAAAGGIDVQQVSFTGATGLVGSGFAFRADGAQIFPDSGGHGGAVQAGAGVLQGTSTGASLDTSAKQMTGTPTISAAGSGYSVGDTCADTNGNVIKVATLSGSAVATFVVERRGWSSAGSPPATGTFPAISTGSTTSKGTGLVLNLTWTANTTLFLQPTSGGTLKLGSGCFTANASTAVTLTALAPAGASSTVQEWLTITDSAGTVRYIPCF